MSSILTGSTIAFKVDGRARGRPGLEIHDPRALIAEWREDYNRSRPRTSLGGLTPTEFGARADEAQNQNGLSL